MKTVNVHKVIEDLMWVKEHCGTLLDELDTSMRPGEVQTWRDEDFKVDDGYYPFAWKGRMYRGTIATPIIHVTCMAICAK